MKTSELQGAALNWAVAMCEGRSAKGLEKITAGTNLIPSDYSTNWSQGGLIIEREGITVGPDTGINWWVAQFEGGVYIDHGPTPLIAAMRCYVASKLGDDIELPEELK